MMNWSRLVPDRNPGWAISTGSSLQTPVTGRPRPARLPRSLSGWGVGNKHSAPGRGEISRQCVGDLWTAVRWGGCLGGGWNRQGRQGRRWLTTTTRRHEGGMEGLGPRGTQLNSDGVDLKLVGASDFGSGD
jgi:hypothetical protein